MLNQVDAIDPNIPASLKYRILVLGQQRKYGGVIRHSQTYFERYGESPSVLFERGYAHEQLGQFNKAKIDYRRIVSQKHDFSIAVVQLAKLLADEDKAELAEAFTNLENPELEFEDIAVACIQKRYAAALDVLINAQLKRDAKYANALAVRGFLQI